MIIKAKHRHASRSSAWLQHGLQDETFKERWAQSAIKVPLYHGSFRSFDSHNLNHWELGNEFGNGIYLTNSTLDAHRNYADPKSEDLEYKIKKEAPNIAGEICRTSQRNVDPLDPEVLNAARASLTDHNGAIYPAWVFLERPITLFGRGSTMFEWQSADPDVGSLTELTDAFDTLQGAGEIQDADIDLLLSDLKADFPEEAYADELIAALRNSRGLLDASCPDMNTRQRFGHSNEIIRRALEAAGFDGVIDHTIRSKFPEMRYVDYKTVHVIAFREDQVQSTFSEEWIPKPEPEVAPILQLG